MKKIDCILHIGMPKCGSSALQSALSLSPDLTAKGSRKIKYVAIQNTGKVFSGDRLQKQAKLSVTGHAKSVSGDKLCQFSDRKLLKVRRQLESICGGDNNTILVLSNEAWGNQYQMFDEGNLFEKLGLNLHVVMYVRPQIEWFNSAWWQWGAWTNSAFDKWASRQKKRVDWPMIYKAWTKISNVEKVSIRLLPKDISADFFGLLNVNYQVRDRQNSSLSGEVLRLYQKNRILRQNAHDSDIDFVLERHLNFPGKTPWVISKKNIEELNTYFGESNRKLLELLPLEEREQMKQNQAWWSADFHRKKEWSSPSVSNLSQQQAEAVAVSAIQALVDLDLKYRRLQNHSYLTFTEVWMKKLADYWVKITR